MELEENNVPEESGNDYVEIYSKRAIFWFSVLGMPLIGGVLLVMNLWAAGFKKAAYVVGIFSILYTAFSDISVSEYLVHYKVDLKTYNNNLLVLSLLSIALNVTGGLILSEYFFKKYFPEDDYYPKSIANPLIITIIIIIALRFLGVSAGI
jgi:hypothetical protein